MASPAHVVMVIFTIILLIAILASAYIMVSMAVGKKYGLGLFSREITKKESRPIVNAKGEALTDDGGRPLVQDVTVIRTQYHPWVLGGIGIATIVGFLGCVITGNVTASKSAKEGFMSMFGL